jgi:hypothetical protein
MSKFREYTSSARSAEPLVKGITPSREALEVKWVELPNGETYDEFWERNLPKCLTKISHE